MCNVELQQILIKQGEEKAKLDIFFVGKLQLYLNPFELLLALQQCYEENNRKSTGNKRLLYRLVNDQDNDSKEALSIPTGFIDGCQWLLFSQRIWAVPKSKVVNQATAGGNSFPTTN